MKILSLTFISILSLSSSVNSGFFDSALNLVKPSVSVDSVKLNIEFIGSDEDFLIDPSSIREVTATGSIHNKTSKKTINQVQVNIKILECNKLGYDCTQIGEEEIKINTDIPPKQTRYFSELFSYIRGAVYPPTYQHKIVKIKAW